MSDTTPHSFVDGELLTAPNLNTLSFGITELQGAVAQVSANPGGNVDTTTSNSWVSWISLGTIAVPLWAVSATISYTIYGLYPLATSINTNVQVRIGTAGGSVVRLLDNGTANSRFTHTMHDKITGLAGGNQTLAIYANRAGGTSGSYRVDTITVVSVQIIFGG